MVKAQIIIDQLVNASRQLWRAYRKFVTDIKKFFYAITSQI